MAIYAMGDVHGRADLLEAMLEHIEAESGCAVPSDPCIVFLGDIIDRGPDSRKAMDLVVATLKRHPSSRLILGNHEEFLLLFLDRADKRDVVFDHWMRSGGLACAVSYGLNPSQRYETLHHLSDELLELLLRHPDHLSAMRTAERLVESKSHIFVHAGLRPHVPLAEQTDKDLRTIRDDFLESDYDFGRLVVHGHTVTASRLIEARHNRIALDTGAAETGALSCLVVEGHGAERFLQTKKNGRKIEVCAAEPLLIGSNIHRAA